MRQPDYLWNVRAVLYIVVSRTSKFTLDMDSPFLPKGKTTAQAEI